MKKVAFYTLGCKMNFHETAYMQEQFKNKGYQIVPFDEVADIYIINTCTVTSTADAKSRKAVRKAKRKNPEGVVVVTGCYSEVYPEEVEKVKEADIITGNVEKFRMVEIVENFRKQKLVCGVWNEVKFFPLVNLDYGRKSRAFVKIQQGCESFCSYCIIPKARGKYLSERPEKVIEHIKLLIERGYSEIVLTGTHLGAYGKDMDYSLAKLLKELIKIPGRFRIRLSSIEPQEFTEELIEVVTSEKIVSHFHIPLQSGSNKILQLMRRRYTRDYFFSLVEKLTQIKKDVCIGTDVMVGFPGEEECDFMETFSLLNDLPVGYLHVFPYSERKGTRAYFMEGKVKDSIKKERSEKLIELGRDKSFKFRERFKGKFLECVPLGEEGGTVVLSGNYIHIKVDKPAGNEKFLKVKLTEVGKEREDNRGVIVSEDALKT
ncbi:tRNA (N(6)-L-threonylcarbamoyladenosine(37)-C(2))-methylthiotransferase MtaB [Desulfurobacterium atlanticum]|uniref:Threonylcarbamoyladenosine tRNA methylthiotransferase MtaB n=1 Tax=Desulfurobacterium atlanticum TaxID=240169 RepID=A0A239A5B8_9BACT|nr:tRNA (N(6)-L-threonylcarbamoyladenosine(37)-C(2))-methylthiotransferase MtaB [Desulfurobacterium atlanticum]SNR90234.1 threonylcarbamoyladenosine tRNA methylthiotransferase MtaB [Desulfurobacterium atlanticum]